MRSSLLSVPNLRDRMASLMDIETEGMQEPEVIEEICQRVWKLVDRFLTMNFCASYYRSSDGQSFLLPFRIINGGRVV